MECSAYVPSDKHDFLGDMPPFPNSLNVSRDMLSSTTLGDMEDARMTGAVGKKLAPNLFPKEDYIGHINTLKYYLSIGGRIGKVSVSFSLSRKRGWSRILASTLTTVKQLQPSLRRLTSNS